MFGLGLGNFVGGSSFSSVGFGLCLGWQPADHTHQADDDVVVFGSYAGVVFVHGMLEGLVGVLKGLVGELKRLLSQRKSESPR